MAELVGEELKRTIGQTQWQRYESGSFEAPLDVIRAVARVSGLSEAYMFGIELPAPDPSRDRKLTDDGPDSDRERARRVAEGAGEPYGAKSGKNKKRPA